MSSHEMQKPLESGVLTTLGAVFDRACEGPPPEGCRHQDCWKGTVEHSVMCRAHHFEMVTRRPCPY